MDVNGQFDDIFDLTGIEAFVNITELYCQLNALTTLDLSQNTSLVKLFCMDNPLTNLNVTQCIALELFEAEHTQLTDIDLSNNINLTGIHFRDSQLVSLDLTQNTNLVIISCSINNLEVLDIRNGNNTNITGFSAHNNPSLTCIFVDDATYWETNFNESIDPNSHYVETQAECDVLGVNDSELQNIQIYPNPIKNILYINSNSEFGIQNSELRLMDVVGKIVYQATLKTEDNLIDRSGLQKGMYFLTIENSKKQQLTKKIIKL